MDMDDLAGTLKIKPKSLYQRIYYGKLEIPHMKNGKKYPFNTEDVAEYIQSEFKRVTSLYTH
jgi:predicted site-specific integrase-resolvase|tara:strand:+ start:181 stop:366 length:186 start_codon:yes stop_codon:yes gene_type:complete